MELNTPQLGPDGITSFLDTDLYKLTMQCAVLKFFKDVPVTYAFTNRTPEKRLSREAFNWLQLQVSRLSEIELTREERQYLEKHCPYFDKIYLDYLAEFHLNPRDQVRMTYMAVNGDAAGDVDIAISGTWVDTILYEIPVLALTSEAYFRYMDTDWDYEGQVERARDKGVKLLEAGCDFSEFGTRRRRNYHTQALVFRGLREASGDARTNGYPGKFVGTSNVHLAMRFNIPPVGTVAHEWFMGIAALKGDYKGATETALRHWVGAFGDKLGIALTDTFGTPEFLRSFNLAITPVEEGVPMDWRFKKADGSNMTYAQLFSGVRQDSGDPATFVSTMSTFYAEQGIKASDKMIVFSDSLNIERCIEYKGLSDKAGLKPLFGVGTFLTNDFNHLTDGGKSVPMNIVIKLSSACGRHAVKISDNVGKNTGDKETVRKVKQELGYVEKEWVDGDETARWGHEGDKPS